MWAESVRCSCDVALEGGEAQAYNEEAFRYFLGVERRRAARSNRSFLLVLIDVKNAPGIHRRLDPRVAASIFSGLRGCVREVDFIGWFHQQRVVGAVLTQGQESPAPDASRRIGRKITEALRDRVPADTASHLQVRVLQLESAQRS